MQARKLSTHLLFSVSLSLLAPALYAQGISPELEKRYEGAGVVGGATLGTVIGGPPGAFVGAIAGGWIGERLADRRENKLLKDHIETTEQEMFALETQNAALQEQLFAMQQAQPQNNLLASTHAGAVGAGCCADSELVLHFRSNSSLVEPHYTKQLNEFVAYVNSVPDAVIEMSGHADRRGEQANNLALSQERLQSVEATLRELGVQGAAFETTALGAQQPLSRANSTEDNFFDRRVVLKVRSGASGLLSNR